MTDAEILQKAIEKAMKNGYREGTARIEVDYDAFTNEIRNVVFHMKNVLGGHGFAFNYLKIIFSHSFAKAFWGEDRIKVHKCKNCEYWKPYSKHTERMFCPYDGRKLIDGEILDGSQQWKINLQQMVLEENPIQYLRRFL